MNENSFNLRDRSQKCKADSNCDNNIRYLLNAEEQLLQLIISRAPFPEVLNGICIALDCQIGNVVSLISLPRDGAGELGGIATNATVFGLYTFSAEGIVAENDELLGSLEMYCSVRRSPSADELQLIERAKCLAAIAIERHNEADQQGACGVQGEQPMRVRGREWPVFLN